MHNLQTLTNQKALIQCIVLLYTPQTKIKIMNNILQDTTDQNTTKYHFAKWPINNTIQHPIRKNPSRS
jgi:hypothetical protein